MFVFLFAKLFTPSFILVRSSAAPYGNPSSFYLPRALFSDPYQALATDLQKKSSAPLRCPFCPPGELNNFESIQALHKHCLSKHQNQQINNNNNNNSINIINKQLSPVTVPTSADLGKFFFQIFTPRKYLEFLFFSCVLVP